MGNHLLSSRDNPILKRIRLVASGARRAPPDLVLCEGVRTLEEASVSGLELDSVVVAEDFGANEREQRLLARWRDQRRKVFRAPSRLLRQASGVRAPQGALALVRVPVLGLDAAPESALPLIVCACGIQDPGNLGTLIRVSAAAGVSMFCTTPGTVSARNPKSARASAGALFRVPVIEHVPPVDLLDYCHRRAIRLFRTDAAAGTHYRDVDLSQPAALLFGSEGHGITGPAWLELSTIRVPLAAGVESLNVAAAGAIILFEARHQRSMPDRAARLR